jgi:hypothetical protein
VRRAEAHWREERGRLHERRRRARGGALEVCRALALSAALSASSGGSSAALGGAAISTQRASGFAPVSHDGVSKEVASTSLR